MCIIALCSVARFRNYVLCMFINVRTVLSCFVQLLLVCLHSLGLPCHYWGNYMIVPLSVLLPYGDVNNKSGHSRTKACLVCEHLDRSFLRAVSVDILFSDLCVPIIPLHSTLDIQRLVFPKKILGKAWHIAPVISESVEVWFCHYCENFPKK